MLRATLVNQYNDQVDYSLQEAVLVSNEGLVNFRYKYRSLIQLLLVLDLMIFDTSNPRALIYQLDRLKKHLENLPKNNHEHSLPEHDLLVRKAYELVSLANRETLCILDAHANQYLHLDDFLSEIYQLLSGIQQAIAKTYFKHAQSQKQLFSTNQPG